MRICDDLRQAVLQAAIQGKLTKQLPEDGNAADLLKEIAKEKAQIIKEGKIKKEKSLSEITLDEVPFDIPDNWKWCRIGHVLSMQAGKTTIASSIRDSIDDEYKYPCYGGNGVRGYKNEYNREGYHAIVGRQGALCGNINFAKGKFYATEHAVVVDCYANMNMACVGLFLKALNLNQYATATAQPGISVAKILETVFPLPPLAEQHRIVSKANELMTRIDDLEKTETELEKLKAAFPGDMKAALLQAAMQGKLTEQLPSDKHVNLSLLKTKNHFKIVEELDIPDTWINVHLEDITKSIPTKQYQILDSQIKNEGKYPVVSQSKQYSIGYSDIEDKVLNPNHKLIAFGDHTTVVKMIDFAFIVGADGVKLFETNEDIIPEFLYYCMLFNASKIADKGGYSRHYKFIKNIAIPLPPLAEQKRIVEKLDKLLPLCDGLVEE